MGHITRGVTVLAAVMGVWMALTGEVAIAQGPSPFERTE